MTRTSLVVAGAAVLLLAAALRLPGLGDQSLWSDEIYSLESARWPLRVLLSVEDGHPPLYGLIVKALDRLVPADLAGRLVSAVAGVAGVGAMLALGCAVADRRVALLAALLLAIAPLHVWYSREGRMYALLALWSILGSWCFVRALRDGGRPAWAGYALVTAAGLLTHYLYAPIVAAQGGFVALRRGRAAKVSRPVALIGLALLALGAIALPWLGQEAIGFVPRRRTTRSSAVLYTGFTFVGGFGLGPPVEVLQRDRGLAAIAAAYWPAIAAVAAVGGGLVWGAARALPSLGVWGPYLVLWLVVPALVVFLGAWLRDGAYNVRYLFASFPAFVLLAAAGIARLPRRHAVACLAAVGVLAGVSIARDRFDPRYARDDLRGAARWLRTHAGSGTRVAVSAAYVAHGLRHYDGALRVEPLVDRPLRSAAAAEAALATVAGTGGWLVLSREWEDDPAGHLARALAARAPDAEVARLPGIRIFRLPPAGAGQGVEYGGAPRWRR